MIAKHTWNGATVSAITNLLCFRREGAWQLAIDLIITPLKNEMVIKISNKVSSNFLFKVVSISLLPMH